MSFISLSENEVGQRRLAKPARTGGPFLTKALIIFADKDF